MQKIFFLAIATVVTLFLTSSIIQAAELPVKQVALQGRLTDAAGKPLEGTFTARFSIFDSDTSGTALFTETQIVTATKGLFSVNLGSATTGGIPLAFDRPYWVEVKINTETLSPRFPMTSAPYSFYGGVADNSVTTAKIADQAITTSKLGDYSINRMKIAGGEIFNYHLANGAVYEGNIADDQITSVKIRDGTIATADIGDSQVTKEKLQNVNGCVLCKNSCGGQYPNQGGYFNVVSSDSSGRNEHCSGGWGSSPYTGKLVLCCALPLG